MSIISETAISYILACFARIAQSSLHRIYPHVVLANPLHVLSFTLLSVFVFGQVTVQLVAIVFSSFFLLSLIYTASKWWNDPNHEIFGKFSASVALSVGYWVASSGNQLAIPASVAVLATYIFHRARSESWFRSGRAIARSAFVLSEWFRQPSYIV